MNLAKNLEVAVKGYINEYGRDKFDKLLLKFMQENFQSQETNQGEDPQNREPKAISEKTISVTLYHYEDETHRIGISAFSLSDKKIELQNAIFLLEAAKNQLINEYINSK